MFNNDPFIRKFPVWEASLLDGLRFSEENTYFSLSQKDAGESVISRIKRAILGK